MEKYLITGVSGYIASWIVKYLLEEGNNVNGTVRDLQNTAKVGHLLEMQRQYPGLLQLFEADLLNKDSFREAMKDCTVIMHTASPFVINKIKDARKQLIEPAVNGTTNVLSLASEYPLVKRIVLTSSVAAVHGDAADIDQVPQRIFTEAHWNTSSSETHNPYQYSKRLAEEAAWNIYKAQHQWDLVVINPGLVLGPSFSKASDSASLDIMRDLVSGKYRTGVPELYFGIVDVRDIARAHLAAGQTPSASGRHICVGKVLPLLEVARILAEEFPELPLPKRTINKWLIMAIGPLMGISRKFIRLNLGISFAFDTSKSKESLKLEYTPLKQTLVDHVRQLTGAQRSTLNNNIQ